MAARNPFTKTINALTATLRGMVAEALQRSGRESVQSLHGKIGSKNNEYVDAIREKFLSPQQFIDEWMTGALRKAAEWDQTDIQTYGHRYQDHAVHDMIRMLQDPYIREYTELFLERNFYRQYQARVRDKPQDALWEVWFGEKDQEWGLFITPRYDDGWENDVSHIRRAPFDYWTIEHVLTSGFIVPSRQTIHAVPSLDALFDLYQNVFVRMTRSVYSRRFAQEYEAYVRAHKTPLKVPFLIPEFRYEGIAKDHKHRLDFTILSASKGLKVGIELSPWSTHGRIKKKKAIKKAGGERGLEAERIRLWEKDIEKRNNYFLKFGLTTLTFTDTALKDMPATFAKVIPYLEPANEERASSPEVEHELQQYRFDGMVRR